MHLLLFDVVVRRKQAIRLSYDSAALRAKQKVPLQIPYDTRQVDFHSQEVTRQRVRKTGYTLFSFSSSTCFSSLSSSYSLSLLFPSAFSSPPSLPLLSFSLRFCFVTSKVFADSVDRITGLHSLMRTEPFAVASLILSNGCG